MDKTSLPENLFNAVPAIAEDVFVARGARIVGDVRLAAGASVWYNAVLRGDINFIEIGSNTNIQDGCLFHVENDRPCIVKENVTVGHGAILHACTVEEECLIGMGAIILSGAVIGRGCVIAAGALIRENTVVEPFSLMVGVPARFIRTLEPGSAETNRKFAVKYAAVARAHRERGYSADDPSGGGHRNHP